MESKGTSMILYLLMELQLVPLLARRSLEVMRPILALRALGLLEEVLWYPALPSGLRRNRRVGRLSALSLVRTFRWDPWILMRLTR